MHRFPQLATLVWLAIATPFSPANDRPDAVWIEPPGEIDWQPDWRATEQATWASWQQAVNAWPDERRPRVRRMWRVMLLEALFERFAESPQHHARARMELADHYQHLGFLDNQRQLLWKIVERHRDEQPLLREALEKLLREPATLEDESGGMAEDADPANVQITRDCVFK
jgi:hypothetical protein